MKIRVSLSVYLLALCLVLTGFCGALFSYLAAVILHEMAHAERASRKGYVLNEFRLMPYGAALIGEFEGISTRDEVSIAVIGPMFSAFCAVVCVALWWLAPVTYPFTVQFAYASLSLALVNLLPVYPLDGGRIALALLSARGDRKRAYNRLRIVGVIISAAFLTLFIFTLRSGINLSLVTMCVFILVSTIAPDNRCKYVALYALTNRSKRLSRGLPVREIMLFSSAPARNIFHHLGGAHTLKIVGVDKRGRVVGTAAETDFERLPSEVFALTVGDVIYACNKRMRE